ncbi:MAG: 2-oxo acid dehydrogenase subunit E2 [Polyangia bacterium]|jgi:pyruvate dehydrogenase E2 component (dihydrolipoamide acetyltransferase)|nr:2-oxo acid dehydrogenase subunit E2 [Polyangia bacterium]
MPNVSGRPLKRFSLFRKIAIGSWTSVGDPSVYGSLEVDMEAALAYLKAYREATGKRLTVTHLVAKAMGQVLYDHPDANALLRWNRIFLRDEVVVFMQVAMQDEASGKADLSGLTIRNPHQKSLGEILEEVEDKARRVRERRDPSLERTRGIFKYLPHMVLNDFLKLVAFLSYDLNLDLSWAGMPKDPFGAVMITNIGSLGLDEAYVPLIPYSRVPLFLALGAVREVPKVRDGVICARRTMKIYATFDHRFLDGVQAAAMSRTLRDWLEAPEVHFGAISA